MHSIPNQPVAVNEATKKKKRRRGRNKKISVTGRRSEKAPNAKQNMISCRYKG